MKRIYFLLGSTLALGVVLGLLGSRVLSAQAPLTSGTVLQRTELKGALGWEAILVDRILPPGAESGKHTQSGNEIVYIEEGSVIFEAQGKPAVTLKARRDVHHRRWRSAQREECQQQRSCQSASLLRCQEGRSSRGSLGPGEIRIAGSGPGEETARSEGYVCEFYQTDRDRKGSVPSTSELVLFNILRGKGPAV